MICYLLLLLRAWCDALNNWWWRCCCCCCVFILAHTNMIIIQFFLFFLSLSLRMFGSAQFDSTLDSVRYLAVWLPIVYGQFTVVFRSLYPAFATQKILNTSHCNVNLCKYQFSTSWQTTESERAKASAESEVERERKRMEIDRFN